MILALGDTHCSTGFTKRAVARAVEVGASHIVQAGDFGFWPRLPGGNQFLDRVNEALAIDGITLWWADGNHEDHGILYDEGWHNADKPVTIRSNIKYVPRGCLVNINGKRIVFIGGAVSIDQYWRTPGWDWFAEEVPTIAQLERAASHSDVDIVVSHESPVVTGLIGMAGIPENLLWESEQTRRSLEEVMKTLRPNLWVAGHWHQRATFTVEHESNAQTRVEVLGHDDLWAMEKTTLFIE